MLNSAGSMGTNVEDVQNTGQVILVHLINRLKWVLPTCASSLLRTLLARLDSLYLLYVISYDL